MTTLQEFAKKQPGRPRTCAICNLPSDILVQVNEGFRNGIGTKTIDAWLRESGYDVPSAHYHRQAEHHQENS